MSSEKTARPNISCKAVFPNHELDHPFAEGTFRYVAKGTYTEGAQKGEVCVCKWFKTGNVYESHFFDADMDTVAKSIELIEAWNASRQVDKMIRVNEPGIWEFQQSRAGQKALIEPFIENYQKFNSNNG